MKIFLLIVVGLLVTLAAASPTHMAKKKLSAEVEAKLKTLLPNGDIEKRRSQIKALAEAQAKKFPMKKPQGLAIQTQPEKIGNVNPLGDSIPEINHNLGIDDLFLEGDINPTETQLAEMIKEASETSTDTRKKRQFNSQVNKWPNGVVYYTFASDLNQRKRDSLLAAFDYFYYSTCLWFEENSTATNRIEFFNGTGCNSPVGMVGGVQRVSIGDGCEYIGTTAHELTHSLGSHHEQARTDRDNYLTIDLTNVAPDMQSNFLVQSNSYFVNPYEYGSMMQYSASSFTNGGQISMQSKDPKYLWTMGSHRISFYDVYMINKHYQCSDQCDSSTITCSNGGYQNPAFCDQCNCPSGYTGTLCTERPTGNGGATLAANTSWQNYTVTLGGSGLRDVFTTRVDWITAPSGSTIQVALTGTTKNSQCNYGCAFNGVEFQVDANTQATGVVNCCTSAIDQVFPSVRNPTPVISYNSYGVSNFTIKYRYV